MALHDLLLEREAEILSRWKERVTGSIVPAALPTLELLDHFPLYLAAIRERLRVEAGLVPTGPSAIEKRSATEHGEQRLRLGFSLDAVVREYGTLHDVIEQIAHETKLTLTMDEARSLSQSIIVGISEAVSEYTRQRDAELHRQHNEHIGFLAHELRNPLATAGLSFEMLVVAGHLDPELRPSRALSQAIAQMRTLVDHSLTVARSASGAELHPTRTTLKQLVDEAELIAKADADAVGISARTRVENDGEVVLDLRLIRSAISNLVRNAVKYSRAGGQVEVRGRIDGERVVIEVEDRCGGMAPEKVEAAFAPFVRLDADPTKERGFGLGLAISKQAVEAHGGTIRVQNLPGTGCIFAIDLPRDITRG